jgi:spore coat protein U-like protein
MKKILIAAALIASSSAAMAATTTGNVTVTATVGANCILTTVPITFGVYDPLSATAKNGTGQVQLVCTVGATPAVALDNGLNVSGAQRRMISGGTNFLNYDVFQPTTNAAGAACAYVTAFPVAVPGFALTAAPTTASRSYNLCGQVPAGQSAPNGSYTDTVTATITF